MVCIGDQELESEKEVDNGAKRTPADGLGDDNTLGGISHVINGPYESI